MNLCLPTKSNPTKWRATHPPNVSHNSYLWQWQWSSHVLSAVLLSLDRCTSLHHLWKLYWQPRCVQATWQCRSKLLYTIHSDRSMYRCVAHLKVDRLPDRLGWAQFQEGLPLQMRVWQWVCTHQQLLQKRDREVIDGHEMKHVTYAQDVFILTFSRPGLMKCNMVVNMRSTQANI